MNQPDVTIGNNGECFIVLAGLLFVADIQDKGAEGARSTFTLDAYDNETGLPLPPRIGTFELPLFGFSYGTEIITSFPRYKASVCLDIGTHTITLTHDGPKVSITVRTTNPYALVFSATYKAYFTKGE